MKLTNAFLIFLGIGALSMIVMSIHYFHSEPSGILRGNDMTPISWYRLAFLTHIGGGLVAITTGPFQFIGKLRNKRPQLHRRLGYLYSAAVFSSGLAGLVIAPFSMGGITTAIGFSLLSLLWMISLGKALLTIRAGQINEHRKWMFFNYAFTFAAITQRSLLLFAMLPFFSFMPIYKLSAWLPWMINLFIASRLLKYHTLSPPADKLHLS